MSTHTMQSSTMQFGPEWMRVKQPAKTPQGPSPPPPTGNAASASSYSALVSPSPAPPVEKRDETHPFRYTRDEMLKIYRDGGGKASLGLEVERHEGIVRDVGTEPVTLKEMSDSEKKLFANGLNSELRRRPSIDTDRPRLPHNNSGTGSPLRERFPRRRESSDQLVPRRLSLSNSQAPLSPALPSPRTRFGHPPTFDGVLNGGGETWVARRRLSEAKAANASRDPESHEARTTDIREEDEEPTPPPKELTPPMQKPEPNGAEVKQQQPPQDFAAVQWSYLDPQGQLQGPFRADTMQKWFDEGYFTAELLMKRTHIDVDWVAVKDLAQIARSAGIDKLFYAPSVPPAPPGISRLNSESSAQNVPDANSFAAPLQPAPVRTLRSTTLDAFSTNSDSPSSSFGTGRFGNGSPDSNSFGGRASSQYSAEAARFGVPPENSSSLRRTGFGDPTLDHSAHNPRYTGNEIYGTNGMSQTAWPVGQTFDTGFGVAGLGQGSGFGHLRNVQDAGFVNDTPLAVPEYLASNAGFGPGQQYNPLHGGSFIPSQSPAANLFAQGSKAPPPPPTVVATQSPWGAPRVASDSARLPQNQPPSPVQASPWGAPAMASTPSVPKPAEPSPWFAASQGVIDDSSWKEDRGHSLTFSNLGQHNQQFAATTTEEAPKAQPIPSPEPLATETPAKATQPTKARAKSIQQPVVQQPAVAPVVAENEPVIPAGQSKTAWAKDDDSKRPKPSGVTLSLRDIQDAEAKKAATRKVAATTTRPTPSTAPSTDEIQPFTASWGLPTSQAGARPPPVKEAPPVVASTASGTSVGASGTPAPVWTNAVKTTATKKSMKEIQEEEEKRKKLAVKESVAPAARRAYAESTTKAAAPPPTTGGGAWTTVGAPKASAQTPAAAPTRSAVPNATPAASSSNAPRTNGTTAPPRSAPPPAKAPVARPEEHPATPSHEFVRWLSDALKGLNSSVNVEEIMSMLLSFSLDPDASTVELISDLIYANSTTLDGRRFASEFVSKRKADALSRPKAGTTKLVSIADVVKAQPKPPASSEWGGFKVVNKKKKGGRS
ncbi:GYF domain-containing protein [Mycena indigotica]|uniref:GYF domain-containing protein n=1 Tax=Mycena indigotica TaxID=2126181 RepID=A0A8H6W9F0_9AGAR|nr:GYF domain-containing protein [Mycena indigotica]KAF7306543.1 GYF domain-containing protein [Mycena indigotica]